MAALKVIAAGPLTTFQDMGRIGAMQAGYTVAGAMDKYSAVCANALCDNAINAPLLEISLGGLVLESQQDCDIAVCGAKLPLQIDTTYVESWRTHRIKAGQKIHLGYAMQGARAYLAVRGGFVCDTFAGSASTVLRESVGQALKAGDQLPFTTSVPMVHRRICVSQQPRWSNHVVLRVLPIQQYHQFSRTAKRQFFSERYQVTGHASRMGYRLQGCAIEYAGQGLISQALAVGTVQIPPNGQPIVMLRDHQTMGGYPKIACVIPADLDKLAQLQQGASVQFAPVTFGQATLIDRAYNAACQHPQWKYI
jgi:biotin-dependent carboxylase-like uncharacterized protein